MKEINAMLFLAIDIDFLKSFTDLDVLHNIVFKIYHCARAWEILRVVKRKNGIENSLSLL